MTRPLMRRRGDVPLPYRGRDGATPCRHSDEEDEDDASIDGSASNSEWRRRAGSPVTDDGDRTLLDGLLYRLLPAVVECMMLGAGGRQLSADACQVCAGLATIPRTAPRASAAFATSWRRCCCQRSGSLFHL